MNYLGDVMESFAGEVLSSLGLQRRSTVAELLVPAPAAASRPIPAAAFDARGPPQS